MLLSTRLYCQLVFSGRRMRQVRLELREPGLFWGHCPGPQPASTWAPNWCSPLPPLLPRKAEPGICPLLALPAEPPLSPIRLGAMVSSQASLPPASPSPRYLPHHSLKTFSKGQIWPWSSQALAACGSGGPWREPATEPGLPDLTPLGSPHPRCRGCHEDCFLNPPPRPPGK